MISFSPSTTWAVSSGEMRAMRRPSRSTASVRIWLIFTHERLGNRTDLTSRVRGKPARCGWLVMAAAMTVPDRALKTSWLKTSQGRRPACSEPRVKLRSAQRTSPLSTGATCRGPRRALLRPGLSRTRGPGWRTREPGARECANLDPAFQARQLFGDGLLHGPAAVGEHAARHQAIEPRQRGGIERDGDLGAEHGIPICHTAGARGQGLGARAAI